jgi:hypothetical protein
MGYPFRFVTENHQFMSPSYQKSRSKSLPRENILYEIQNYIEFCRIRFADTSLYEYYHKTCPVFIASVVIFRLVRRWEDIIRTDLKEIWCESVDWMHLAQDREHLRPFVNTVMNLRVP